jgi:hypothetical protein
LVFTNRYYLRNISLQSNNYNLIRSGFHAATGVSYDYDQRALYVSDADGAVHRIQVDSDNRTATTSYGTTVFTDDMSSGSIGGIAVDWIGKKLYCLLTTARSLIVSELNGHYRLSLLNSSVLQEPSSIVLDPFAGYLFFTDWQYPAYIGTKLATTNRLNN